MATSTRRSSPGPRKGSGSATGATGSSAKKAKKKAKAKAGGKTPSGAKGATARRAPASKKGTKKKAPPGSRPATRKKGRPSGSTGADRRPAARRRRYAVVHDDVDRPHMRLGFLWFVALVAALVLGPPALGVLCGLVAGVGGLQVAKAWRRRRQPAFVPVAGAAAAVLPIAAAWGGRALGAAILLGLLASVAGGVLRPGRLSPLAAAGWTVRSWLFVGGAAATLVLVVGFDTGAGIALVVLMSAYDAGDYVVGSGARTVWEGPLGGVAAVAVLTLSLYVVNLSPFHGAAVVGYGIALAVLAPLGQLAASAVLPEADVIASGLRRFDSILLAGPVWAVLLAAGAGI